MSFVKPIGPKAVVKARCRACGALKQLCGRPCAECGALVYTPPVERPQGTVEASTGKRVRA